jgi:hypothetical protein
VAQGAALAAGAEIADGPATVKGLAWVPELFVKGRMGGFSYEAEIDYAFGRGSDATDGADDVTVSALEWTAEGAYDFGPITVRAGYLYIQGDSDTSDDRFGAFAYIEESAELDQAFILVGTDENKPAAGLQDTLGGFGNVSAGPVTTSPTVRAGLRLAYAGAKLRVLDNVSFDVLVAKAEADDPLPGWDTDQGYEYDFSFDWQIYKNLGYKAVFAYLDAGDWWKGGDPTAELIDTYTLYHGLFLDF